MKLHKKWVSLLIQFEIWSMKPSSQYKTELCQIFYSIIALNVHSSLFIFFLSSLSSIYKTLLTLQLTFLNSQMWSMCNDKKLYECISNITHWISFPFIFVLCCCCCCFENKSGGKRPLNGQLQCKNVLRIKYIFCLKMKNVDLEHKIYTKM